MQLPTGALSRKQGMSKKLIIGFAALAGAAIVSTIGMAKANQAPFQTIGYGGDATVHTNVQVDAKIDGNNNIIHVVVSPVYNFFSNLAN